MNAVDGEERADTSSSSSKSLSVLDLGRIYVDLSDFFKDSRKKCVVHLDGKKFRKIEHLKAYLSNFFHLNDETFVLMKGEYRLLETDSILVLEREEGVWLNRYPLNCFNYGNEVDDGTVQDKTHLSPEMSVKESTKENYNWSQETSKRMLPAEQIILDTNIADDSKNIELQKKKNESSMVDSAFLRQSEEIPVQQCQKNIKKICKEKAIFEKISLSVDSTCRYLDETQVIPKEKKKRGEISDFQMIEAEMENEINTSNGQQLSRCKPMEDEASETALSNIEIDSFPLIKRKRKRTRKRKTKKSIESETLEKTALVPLIKDDVPKVLFKVPSNRTHIRFGDSDDYHLETAPMPLKEKKIHISKPPIEIETKANTLNINGSDLPAQLPRKSSSLAMFLSTLHSQIVQQPKQAPPDFSAAQTKMHIINNNKNCELNMKTKETVLQRNDLLMNNTSSGFTDKTLAIEKKSLQWENMNENAFLELPLLEKAPMPNDKIAFKVLCLGQDYSPQLSDWVIGLVTHHDSDNGNLRLVILRGTNPLKRDVVGKFELEDTIEEQAEDVILIDWKDMVGPRKI